MSYGIAQAGEADAMSRRRQIRARRRLRTVGLYPRKCCCKSQYFDSCCSTSFCENVARTHTCKHARTHKHKHLALDYVRTEGKQSFPHGVLNYSRIRTAAGGPRVMPPWKICAIPNLPFLRARRFDVRPPGCAHVQHRPSAAQRRGLKTSTSDRRAHTRTRQDISIGLDFFGTAYEESLQELEDLRPRPARVLPSTSKIPPYDAAFA
ncbi:hypothetical protein EVAR_7261_1 [Eumeta japonica]|uniref:Uncharacterized protein n=1 Tax=Eumeta variegata TaxID=151549 RepID=A0A4C1T512_EUMVA|nr:hypothetical protein EVAR_7261_1 [Eumeta japonica]